MRKRFQKIIDLIKDDYIEVWDLCCDHGVLGLSLLKNNKFKKVHFVDCVPGIIKKLHIKLSPFEGTTFSTHAIDAQKICSIDERESLIIISGVGGETIVKILAGLKENNDISKHDFIFCTQNQSQVLREFLIDHHFKLKSEELVFDAGVAYELLMVHPSVGREIDLVGINIFDLSQPDHLSYLKKKIAHLKKKSKGGTLDPKILQSYEGLLTNQRRP